MDFRPPFPDLFGSLDGYPISRSSINSGITLSPVAWVFFLSVFKFKPVSWERQKHSFLLPKVIPFISSGICYALCLSLFCLIENLVLILAVHGPLREEFR